MSDKIVITTESDQYFDRLTDLLRLEEVEEKREYEEQFLRKSPDQREKAGKSLLKLVVSDIHFSGGGHQLVSFGYENGRPLPIYSFDVGDVVSLSRELKALENLPVGTVYDRTSSEITLAFNRRLPDWINDESLFYLNEASPRESFQKMFDSIKRVKEAQHDRLAYFRNLSFGEKKPMTGDPIPIDRIRFNNPGLNQWQKIAVQKALEALDIAVIHGPPGTGKTTVLVEIIRQAVSAEQLIFVTAPSNTACDHLLNCLVRSGIKAVRLGHPARIMDHLKVHTLDFKLANHVYSKVADDLLGELKRLFRQKARKKERRPLTTEEKIELDEKIRSTRNEIDALEENVWSQVVDGAQVWVGTHTSGNDRVFENKTFDLLVIDEATQGVEPSTWIPMAKAKKVILAGDHKQLPPTVMCEDAKRKGLDVTLFERFKKILGPDHQMMLKLQYRMHEKIMSFSSKKFYGGELVADESVRLHTLADLSGVKRTPEIEQPFVFLDTVGRGFEEKLEPGSGSKFNIEEAAFVVGELNRLIDAGVKAEDIAVISPYSAQVRLLESQIQISGVEIASIDSFQGREKEAVIISLVRSNTEGKMGFLTDVRRMNVALTRARRKLFVVGDSGTLATIPFYKAFIEYAEAVGGYKSSWEEV